MIFVRIAEYDHNDYELKCVYIAIVVIYNTSQSKLRDEQLELNKYNQKISNKKQGQFVMILYSWIF